jgi:hypothetical protein
VICRKRPLLTVPQPGFSFYGVSDLDEKQVIMVSVPFDHPRTGRISVEWVQELSQTPTNYPTPGSSKVVSRIEQSTTKT